MIGATLRTLATVAVSVTLYDVLPFDYDVDPVMVAEITLGCAVLAVVVVWQPRTVSRSPYPGIRAVEALAFTVPVYVLVFATTYFVMAYTAVSSFTEALTRTDALYFLATTIATVGYGDIAANSESPPDWLVGSRRPPVLGRGQASKRSPMPCVTRRSPRSRPALVPAVVATSAVSPIRTKSARRESQLRQRCRPMAAQPDTLRRRRIERRHRTAPVRQTELNGRAQADPL